MAETTRSQLNVPTKRVLLFVGALVAVLATLVIFRAIFWPLLLGLAIAYLLDPLVTRLEQRRVPRALGVVVTGLLFLGTLTLALVVVLPAVADQLHRLAERLPAYWQGLVRMARPWLGRLEDELPASAQDLPQAVALDHLIAQERAGDAVHLGLGQPAAQHVPRRRRRPGQPVTQEQARAPHQVRRHRIGDAGEEGHFHHPFVGTG
jgi:predicted PurR-regulated permease PerM